MTSIGADAEIVAYIDGGARGNPGPAGYGVRIEHPDGTLVEEFGEAIGVTTNNVAEYHGLLAALDYARGHGYRRVHIRSDSLLLVQQMLGHYKVRNEGLQPLHGKARLLVHEIGRVTFEHVPRSANAHADRLANAAMDDAGGSKSGTRTPPALSVADASASRAPSGSQRAATAGRTNPLSPVERAVRAFIYRHFADTARAPSTSDICAATGTRELEVIGALHRLADVHALVLAPASTTIWMAHPFSAVPTAFRVGAGGRTYFANCAWDAAGVLVLVGDGDVSTECGDCGADLGFAVRGQTLLGDGVVHFAIAPTRFWDNIAFT